MRGKLRVVVDRDLCEANAVCVGEAPDAFDLDDAERLRVLMERPDGPMLDEVRAAVRRCPRGALALVDE